MSSLIKSNVFPTFSNMLEDFWNTEKFFSRPLFPASTLPAVNVKETEQNYEVELAVPGFKKDELKISTENGVLSISAETSSEQTEEDDRYTRREFSCNSFSRSFSLPENVLPEDIKAKYEDGLVRIDIKKNGATAKPRNEISID